MPIDWRRRERVERFDHGGPLVRADPLPILIFFSCLVMVGLTFDRIPTHVLKFDLPNEYASWEAVPGEQTHLIVVTQGGAIEWNGVAVTHEDMELYLASGLYQAIEPQIVFAPEAKASYALAFKVLASIKALRITKFCFGELEGYRHFGKDVATYRLNVSYFLPEVSPIPTAPHGIAPHCSDPFR